MAVLPNKRALALTCGAEYYDTGRPCKRGHLSKRHAKTGACLLCGKEKAREWRAKNPGASYATTKRWRAKNVDKHLNDKRAAYQRNRAEFIERATARVRRMPEQIAAYLADWRRANKGKVNAYTRARDAAQLQRTPPWADLRSIEAFYVACPPGHHVDHIVPLRGRLVSGLHVIDNLQYLVDIENIRKSNKFDPDTYRP